MRFGLRMSCLAAMLVMTAAPAAFAAEEGQEACRNGWKPAWSFGLVPIMATVSQVRQIYPWLAKCDPRPTDFCEITGADGVIYTVDQDNVVLKRIEAGGRVKPPFGLQWGTSRAQVARALTRARLREIGGLEAPGDPRAERWAPITSFLCTPSGAGEYWVTFTFDDRGRLVQVREQIHFI